jgi:hypothetical protein
VGAKLRQKLKKTPANSAFRSAFFPSVARRRRAIYIILQENYYTTTKQYLQNRCKKNKTKKQKKQMTKRKSFQFFYQIELIQLDHMARQ